MRFRELPGRLRVFLASTVVLAGIALFASVWRHPFRELHLLGVLIVLAVLAGALKVELTVRWGRMSLGSAVTYFTMVALGIPEAALVNAVTAIASMGLNRRQAARRHGFVGIPLYRILFNVSNHVLAAIVSGAVFQLLGGKCGEMRLESAAVPILGSVTAYYVTNTFGIATAVAWSQGMSVAAVWRENFLWTAPGYLASACAAAAMAYLHSRGWDGASLLLLPPFYIVYYSYRLYMEKIHGEVKHISELNELNSSVITSLAMAIDAKDSYTHSHINRVREFAVGLAEKLQVGREELEAIKIAALLHDIGKLGVPEHILGKPGKLTPEEFEQIKAHVTIGAMILEPVRFPWPVIPIVLTHHERWDGNGYPNGLKGEEIPIGGRIVALADVFDALTSTRPYRKAMERDKAIEFLRAGSGAQFDPRVVEAFVEALPEIDERLLRLELHDNGEEAAAADGDRAAPANVLDQIARTNAESLALCELADLIAARPELDATMELIVQKVEKLIPFSTCAVFLVDEQRTELRAAYVAGLVTELFQDMTIKLGEGASGWVVEHIEPVMNSPASLDVARRIKPTDNLELSSTMAAPLMADGVVVGTLTLYHTGYNFYKPHHLRLLTLIAEHAGPAIDSARQFAQTRQLAMEDTLSGLPNARALTHFLRHQISECERREQEFTVLLMDLDNFKQVNDQLGHLEGDRVLQHVSRLLQSSVREMDFVARYAGDEFVVVMPYAGLDTAEEIMERVRDSIHCCLVQGQQFELGISIGCAVYPADGTDTRLLLGVADGRMYTDKSHRKRATVAA